MIMKIEPDEKFPEDWAMVNNFNEFTDCDSFKEILNKFINLKES